MQESNSSPIITTKRRHSAAFKRKILELTEQPGASVAAIALEHGVNANLVFKWRRAKLERKRGAGPARQAVLLAVCGPVTASQLLDLPFPEVLLGAPLTIDEHYSEWAPWLGSHNLARRRGVTLEDSRLRVQAAEDEMGIAMLSRQVVDAAMRGRRVVAVPKIPTFPLPCKWLSKSKLKPRTPSVEIAFEWLRGFDARSQ